LINLGAFMLLLHGTVLVLALLWLAKRHHNLKLRDWLRAVGHKGRQSPPAEEARP
jgi:hypothetical protein